MDQKEIFAFISRFEESSLTVMEIEEEDFKLKLEKPGPQTVAVAPVINSVQEASAAQPAAAVSQPSPDNGFEKVKSPIVGVYYQAPSPEEPAFVSLGQKVSKGQILCLVEAMKMMNELKSPVDGIIKAVHGTDGQLVEFDQVLFEVEPC
ncbi:acetyl-CoA carboxylase biotin carboxyl carrier protein [Clostridiales Family XIII bacterium PM5-7]